MKQTEKTLTVVNTGVRKVSSSSSEPATYVRGSSSHGSGGASVVSVQKVVDPIVGESYADLLTELVGDSLLTNTAFANDGEGWVFDGDARLSVSDHKKRLFVFGGSGVHQLNELIRKPGTHSVYVKEDWEGSEVATETYVVKDSLVTDAVEWGDIAVSEKEDGVNAEDDMVYLSVSFVCRMSGSLSVGFPMSGSGFWTEGIEASEGEEVQSFSTEGRWDGSGDFYLQADEGEFEIVSLRLLDKPFESYRVQTDSALAQLSENLSKAFHSLCVAVERVKLIQQHVNQLYGNDAILDGLVKNAQSTADTAKSWALDNWGIITDELRPDIGDLKTNVGELLAADALINARLATFSDKVDALSISLVELEERVTALDGGASE